MKTGAQLKYFNLLQFGFACRLSGQKDLAKNHNIYSDYLYDGNVKLPLVQS